MGGYKNSITDINGNVGIGTKSPNDALEIHGNLNIGDGTSVTSIGLQRNSANYITATDAAGYLVFRTGGANEQMRITSGGQVSVTGAGTAASPSLIVAGDSDTGWFRPFSNTIGFTTGGNERLRIQSNGAIGINGNNYLYAFPSTANTSFIGSGFSLDGASNEMTLWTNNTERIEITSGGDVLFGAEGIPDGTTYYGSGFIPVSTDKVQLRMASSSTIAGSLLTFHNPNGSVGNITITGTTTAYNETSDYRLKENVVPITGALDRVDALKPSRFNFIADADTTVDGFLAHELAEVVPEAVTGEKDAVEGYEVTPAVLDDEGNVIEEAVMGTRPVYQGIDKSKIVPLLVGAIQELKAEIETLKSQINN
jgi:hypothetical protein